MQLQNAVLDTNFSFIIRPLEKMELFFIFGLILTFTFADSKKNVEKTSK